MDESSPIQTEAMRIEVLNPIGFDFIQIVHDLPQIKVIRTQVDREYGRGSQLCAYDGEKWEVHFTPRDWEVDTGTSEWGQIAIYGVPEHWWADVSPDKDVPTIILYDPRLEELEGEFVWTRP